VTVVGGNEAVIAGHGTIKLISTYNGQEYLLQMEDIIHVPGMWNNLILLGQWDAAEGRYSGGGGRISLITKTGITVAQGKKINNHLYKMKIKIQQTPSPMTKTHLADALMSLGQEPSITWEMWHQ
jgi:hypothetical protein